MKNKKNIVIVNQDSGYLMIDVAHAFQETGYHVTLVAGRLVERNTPLSKEIEVCKIIKYNKSNTFQRLFTWIWAAVQIYFLILFRFRNSEILFVSNPPIAPLLSIGLRNRCSLLIYDIYPDALIDAQIIGNNSFVAHCWKRLNMKAFMNADKIYTISEGMKQTLLQYINELKLKVIPVWADNEFLSPVNPNENIFIQKYGLQDKFIVLYSGNLGKTGDADIMVELAKQTDDKSIHYVIIGNGVKRAEIEKQIKESRIANCTLLPWQESAMLPYSLSSASLAVVALGSQTSKIAMPSKLYSYLAVGAPILSLAAPDSDLAVLVEKERVGKNFDPEKIDAILQFVIDLKSDISKQTVFSKNALKISLMFTKINAKLFIEN
jgi:glycosyltransferase involved in cell wall biosynthesis